MAINEKQLCITYEVKKGRLSLNWFISLWWRLIHIGGPQKDPITSVGSNFEAFNFVEGVNPIRNLWHKDRNLTKFSVLNVFSFIFLKTYWVSWGSYMRWSQFVSLKERGSIVIFATWNFIAIMTCSVLGDVRAVSTLKELILLSQAHNRTDYGRFVESITLRVYHLKVCFKCY